MLKYSVPILSSATAGIALTAAGEILAITGIAGHVYQVRRVVLKNVNNTLPTAQQIQVSGGVYTTVTGGTGGFAITPVPLEGGTASTATVLAGNTVPNTGTTSANPIYEDGCYLYQGIDTPLPGDGIWLVGAQIFSLKLVQAPAGAVSITLTGYVELWELG